MDMDMNTDGDGDSDSDKRPARDIMSGNIALSPKFITTLHNFAFAGLWFFFSTALSLYNKNLLGKDQYNFNFPLLIVATHSLCQFAFSTILMNEFPKQFTPKSRPTPHNYLTRVVPTAICTALDISMSNASLHYISLSFYTMVKSSTPVWVLVFAFMFGLEKPRISLILVIFVICIGVVFTVVGEIRFSFYGFLLILGASILSGLRWSLTQILLQNASLGMDNPVATLQFLSPVGALIIGSLAMIWEIPGPNGIIASHFFDSWSSALSAFGVISIGAILAFCMTLAEYYLIRNTSVVTLSVVGMSKEILIISLSMIIFGDRLTATTFLGLLITISGIATYHWLKSHSANGHGHGHGYSTSSPVSAAAEETLAMRRRSFDALPTA